ncbi:MAG: hypothetical protein M0Z50_15515 [Planctomycetia bacterium]|nr:hypothetical protein [Planctomycetia bacterium]
MSIEAETLCTKCGTLYHGNDRCKAIRIAVLHGNKPENDHHIIITEIRETGADLRRKFIFDNVENDVTYIN